MKRLDAEIRLHLNPKEESAMSLIENVATLVSLCELCGSPNGYGEGHYVATIIARDTLARNAATYIKDEWEIIKSSLNNAKVEWP